MRFFGKGHHAQPQSNGVPSHTNQDQKVPSFATAGAGIETPTGDPVMDALRAVLSALGDLSGHPVTGIRSVGLLPVAATLSEELKAIERAQVLQALYQLTPQRWIARSRRCTSRSRRSLTTRGRFSEESTGTRAGRGPSR